jgi:hypothetical protein
MQHAPLKLLGVIATLELGACCPRGARQRHAEPQLRADHRHAALAGSLRASRYAGPSSRTLGDIGSVSMKPVFDRGVPHQALH